MASRNNTVNSKPNGVPTGTTGKICQFKVVLLGESAVGKSSLVLRFVKREFHEFQESTIGAAFLTQTVTIDDTTVKFEIWDTAGQERYHSLAPMYYRGAQAAMPARLQNTHASNQAGARSYYGQRPANERHPRDDGTDALLT